MTDPSSQGEQEPEPTDSKAPATGLNTEVHPDYVRAIRHAVCFQVVIYLVASMTLDCGRLVRLFAITLLAFWAGVGISIVRKPGEPSTYRVMAVRYGFFFFFILASLYARWLGHI